MFSKGLLDTNMLLTTNDGTTVAEITYDRKYGHFKGKERRRFEMIIYDPSGKPMLKIDRGNRHYGGDALLYMFNAGRDQAERLVGEIKASKNGPRYNYDLFDYTAPQFHPGVGLRPFAHVNDNIRKYPVKDDDERTICALQNVCRTYVHYD